MRMWPKKVSSRLLRDHSGLLWLVSDSPDMTTSQATASRTTTAAQMAIRLACAWLYNASAPTRASVAPTERGERPGKASRPEAGGRPGHHEGDHAQQPDGDEQPVTGDVGPGRRGAPENAT